MSEEIIKIINDQYLKTINKIDDFFEYRYVGFDREEIKKEIMGYIGDISKNLSKPDPQPIKLKDVE